MVKSVMEAAIHNVYKVTPNNKTHKIEQFLKGVWWVCTKASNFTFTVVEKDENQFHAQSCRINPKT